MSWGHPRVRLPVRGGGAACVDVERHRPPEAPLRRDRPAHPPGRCSSLYRLDERLLGELRPGLIVTQGLCAVRAVSHATVSRAARRLAADVPVLSLEPATLGDILATAATVGAATGHEREAGRLVASKRARMDAVGSLPPPAGRPRVACLEWTSPTMAAGHWLPELARLAGGGDPFGQAGEPSRDAGWDEILEAAPDVVVLMPCGFDLARTLAVSADVTRRPGFGQLPAARTAGVVAVDVPRGVGDTSR